MMQTETFILRCDEPPAPHDPPLHYIALSPPRSRVIFKTETTSSTNCTTSRVPHLERHSGKQKISAAAYNFLSHAIIVPEQNKANCGHPVTKDTSSTMPSSDLSPTEINQKRAASTSSSAAEVPSIPQLGLYQDQTNSFTAAAQSSFLAHEKLVSSDNLAAALQRPIIETALLHTLLPTNPPIPLGPEPSSSDSSLQQLNPELVQRPKSMPDNHLRDLSEKPIPPLPIDEAVGAPENTLGVKPAALNATETDSDLRASNPTPPPVSTSQSTPPLNPLTLIPDSPSSQGTVRSQSPDVSIITTTSRYSRLRPLPPVPSPVLSLRPLPRPPPPPYSACLTSHDPEISPPSFLSSPAVYGQSPVSASPSLISPSPSYHEDATWTPPPTHDAPIILPSVSPATTKININTLSHPLATSKDLPLPPAPPLVMISPCEEENPSEAPNPSTPTTTEATKPKVLGEEIPTEFVQSPGTSTSHLSPVTCHDHNPRLRNAQTLAERLRVRAMRSQGMFFDDASDGGDDSEDAESDVQTETDLVDGEETCSSSTSSCKSPEPIPTSPTSYSAEEDEELDDLEDASISWALQDVVSYEPVSRVKRTSRMWVLERNGVRWEEENYASVLRALRHM